MCIPLEDDSEKGSKHVIYKERTLLIIYSGVVGVVKIIWIQL
jgi:hypothetical protein